MLFKIKPHYLIFLLLLLQACTREMVVLEDFGSDRKMAVMAVIDASGSFSQFKLSASQKVIGGSGSGAGEPVKDASLLVISGTDTLVYPYEENLDAYATMPPAGFYESGKKYTLRIQANEKDEIAANCQLIQAYEAPIDSVQIQSQTIDFVTTLQFHISFKDQDQQKNYYRVLPVNLLVNEMDSSDTLSFALNNSSLVLLDETYLVNGHIVADFNLENQGYEIPGFKNIGIKVYVMHVDELYYQYHQKIALTSTFNEMENPIFVPGNAQGGYGVFCSTNGISQKIVLLP